MQSIESIIQEEVNVKALELMPEDHPLDATQGEGKFQNLRSSIG